jgi:poly(3-hydroxybutyrate) depolymerase
VLYSAYELRRTVLNRVGAVLNMQERSLGSIPPPLGSTTPVRAARAATQVAQALQLTHERPDFGVTTVSREGRNTDVREEVVTGTPFGELIHFTKADGSWTTQPKVLIVPGLAGHFATLVRATISTMLVDHDVYVAAWHNARDVPVAAGDFGLDEYIEHLMDFLRAIGPGTHLLGVCQPAVACLVAASIMAEDEDPAQPASLILLAGPVDTRINPGRISRLVQRQSVRTLERTMLHRVPRGFAGAGRRVYPGFMQISGFIGMDPRRHVTAFRSLFRDLRVDDIAKAARTTAFYKEYFAVLDIAGEFYLETAQRVFIDNDLPRGQFHWRGRPVDPSAIHSALFTIEGALDEMCCPGQTKAAHDLCTGIPPERRDHLLQDGVGHYGVFAGSVFDGQIYPQIRDFIAMAAAAA